MLGDQQKRLHRELPILGVVVGLGQLGGYIPPHRGA